MYLLNRETRQEAVKLTGKFTFHYVSIKSCVWAYTVRACIHLHSTMYLLNRKMCKNKQKEKQFTFHYVSIKSQSRADNRR